MLFALPATCCPLPETDLTNLLDNPAIQAAALPFVVALVLAFALSRTRFLALAVASGLVVVVGLTIGYAFELPLSSVTKLIAGVLGLTLAALALEAAGVAARPALVATFALAGGLAALWVVQRVLQQAEGGAAFALALGAFAIVTLTAGGTLAAGLGSSLRAAVVSACLGWGAGVLALLGASALLAQLGLALGSAAAAVASMQMIRGRESPLGWTVAIPVAIAAPLIAVLASATGELRWYALIPLPFGALAGLTAPTGRIKKSWQAAFVIGCATLVPVVVAAAIAWLAAAPAPAAG